MKRSALAYAMVPIMAVAIIVGGSLLMAPKPKTFEPISLKPSYRLKVLVKPGTATPAKYGMSDLMGAPLRRVLDSPILEQMAAKATKVIIERDGAPLPDKDTGGLAIVAVEPKEFTAADVITIKVRKVKPLIEPPKPK